MTTGNDPGGPQVAVERAESAPGRPNGGTFSSLRIRNYRLYFYGQTVSISGMWMETVAQSFLVLHLTGSGSALGLAIAARFGPLVLIGPWGGLIADRFDKRRILYLTQVMSALTSVTVGALTASGTVTMTAIYLLSAVAGLVNVFDNPARQSIISELVPAPVLPNAVALNSTMINVARLAGAGVGGIVATTVGLAACYFGNALSVIAVLVTLALMSPAGIVASQRASRSRGQVRAGFRYVASTPRLFVPLTMIAIVGALAWEFPVSLPLIASGTFHGDAATYGVMTAAMGLGAVVGGLVTASRSVTRPVALAVAGMGWGIAIIVAALAPNLITEYVLLLAVGYGSISFNAIAKTSLQLASVPAMRGRVMALWFLAWQGSTPIGAPIVGWLAEHLGARWGLLVGGIATVVVSVVAYPILRRIGRPPVE